jgi:hypothetical protein
MTTPVLSYSDPRPCRLSAELSGVTTADAFISEFYVVKIGIGQLRTAFFWVVKQQIVVIPYQRFGTTSQSRLQG